MGMSYFFQHYDQLFMITIITNKHVFAWFLFFKISSRTLNRICFSPKNGGIIKLLHITTQKNKNFWIYM